MRSKSCFIFRFLYDVDNHDTGIVSHGSDQKIKDRIYVLYGMMTWCTIDQSVDQCMCSDDKYVNKIAILNLITIGDRWFWPKYNFYNDWTSMTLI